MRRLILPAAVLAVCWLASQSQAGISGSAHDFGTKGWSGNQICAPCHTPHFSTVKDSNGGVLDGPLWNHTLSSKQTYKLYYDASLNPVSGAVDQNSKLCLSCHDGTVALDSFGGVSGTNFIAPGAKIGGDADELANDHPIGEAAIWPAVNPSYMVDPALRKTAGIMPLRKMADGRDAVGCTSCHEPHNRKNTAKLLWVSNSGAGTTVDGRTVTGSLLCMNCHKK